MQRIDSLIIFSNFIFSTGLREGFKTILKISDNYHIGGGQWGSIITFYFFTFLFQMS